MAQISINDEKLKEVFIDLVRKDIIAQKEKTGQAFFIDKDVYDMCYPSVEATVDDASLSKLFLRYNPSLKPSELKYLFSPGESSASKLFTLRTIGGETYGYHLLYMTLREDKKDIPSRKDAVFNLEITAKRLGKKPPDDLFGPDEPEPLPRPVPVNTLETMHISSPKKPVTQPLGEDVSMNKVQKQEPSKSLDSSYRSHELLHHPNCNCGNCGMCGPEYRKSLSVPDKIEVSNQKAYSKGFEADEPGIENNESISSVGGGLAVSSVGSGSSDSRAGNGLAVSGVGGGSSVRNGSAAKLCVDTDTSVLSPQYGDSVMSGSSSASAYNYQTVPHTTETPQEPNTFAHDTSEFFPDVSNPSTTLASH